MASNCSPKVLQFSNAVKKVPLPAAVKYQMQMVHRNEQVSGTIITRAYSSTLNKGLAGPSFKFGGSCGKLVGVGVHECLTRSRVGPGSTVNVRNGRASMSSWLQSSRILFIKGTGNDNGDGDDPVFPSTTRRTRGKELGESSILRQEGHSIDEVPVAVIRSDSSSGQKAKGNARFKEDFENLMRAFF